MHRCNRQSRENNLSFLHSFIQFYGIVIKIVEISTHENFIKIYKITNLDYTHKDHTCVKGTDDGREKRYRRITKLLRSLMKLVKLHIISIYEM